MEKIQGIYKIYNTITNKVYIGQSIDIEKRWKEHQWYAFQTDVNHPLYNSIRKYNVQAFEFSILEKVIDELKLNEREQYYIDYFQSYIPEKGYNILQFVGTTRGYKHKEETKEKFSKIHKGKKLSEEHKKNFSWLGRKHSEETKKKMSEWQKGKKCSEEHIRNSSNARKGLPSSRKGCKLSDETKKKLSNVNKGKKLSEECKQKISITSAEYWSNPENRRKHGEKVKQTNVRKKLEKNKRIELVNNKENESLITDNIDSSSMLSLRDSLIKNNMKIGVN